MVEVKEKLPIRERILEAAIKIFGRSGYDGAALQDVATEAGVTKPTLYNHFENKARLYEEMLFYVHRLVREACEASAEHASGPRDRLLALIRTRLSFARKFRELIKATHSALFLPEALRPKINYSALMDHQFGQVHELVREAVAQGDLAGDPMSIALVISGTFGAISLSQAIFPDLPLLQTGIEERLLEVIMQGALPR